jgi:BirA family biotin operon repressor/biotin-[acetyl-CoA-carboxylase] ligase
VAPPEPPHSILRLPVVDSTQRVAFELAERGAPDGAVVVAGTQTAGRGRRGRGWHDAPGDCLLTSIVVRPRLHVRDLPQLSLATAVAAREALGRVASLDARLKWPNDVLVGGRKIAGVLLESRTVVAPLVVIGVGINLRQRSFPEALEPVATSVLRETGRAITPETMLDALLASFDAWRGRLEREGFAPVRAAWLAVADTIGRIVEAAGRRGTAVDLDEDGALLVRDAEGLRRVVAGDVVTARGGAGD